ncbi:hypothetical protein [Lactobacillus intestinalis]|uniref:Uncharacterized protein n=1 Tax=Lactobacillus intestinalis DSM 6629 TaxID=1423761 RepID=A0ABR5PV88_9LACO|nr:hypothetical protein [Lactobacillus intestinalis]KRM34611.1 hypothetical protein FC44_GL001325 [Lactobacillus intestinalis DSM 6629]UTW40344.1 hypothetical protein KBW87_00105 [Lactobacillus intestinalis]
MVEIAFSEELNKEIEAKEANKLSRKGSLKSKYTFHCLDPDCAIPLTCTNWGKVGKRYYFAPSSNSVLHIDGCNQISSTELKSQNKNDFTTSKNIVNNGGLIIIDRYSNRPKTQVATNRQPVKSKNNTNHQNNGNNTKGTKTQNSHRSSMYSLIQLWRDNAIPNNVGFLRIDGQRITLNDLFVNVGNLNQIADQLPHIFYGEATVSYSRKKPVGFYFPAFTDAKLYSNYDQLIKRAATSRIKEYINSGNMTTVFFRGYYDQNLKKFKSFNDKFYQDIYIE